MGWLDSIGSVVTGGLGSLFNGSDAASDFLDPLNAFHEGKAERTANKQWMYEYQLQKQNFEEAKDQNEWNRKMQEQSFEYQKALNQLQMEREDTATARRVADLKASGLSPTLAAGSAADTGALHAGSVSQVSPAQAVPAGDSKVRAAMFRDQMMRDSLQLATTLMGNFADVARTKAETQLINAQTDQVSSMTPIDLALKEQLLEFNDEMNPHKIKQAVNDIDLQEKEKAIKDFDLVLMSDDHAMKAYQMAKIELENKLIRANIDIADREYILKGLAIDMATMQNERYASESEEYEFEKQFWRDRGLPINFNPGYGGLSALGSMDIFNGIRDKYNKGRDFVTRQIERVKSAASQVKKTAYNPDSVIKSARANRKNNRKSTNPRSKR